MSVGCTAQTPLLPGSTAGSRMVRRLLVLLCALALAGCAKFPETGVGRTRLLLDLRMTVRGEIDDNAYYLFVIDTNERDTDGPEIIAPLTEFLGNGRATGSYTHYVEYHQGRFEVFKDRPEQQGTTVPPREALGPPFFSNASPSAGILTCTVDLSTLKSNVTDPDFTQVELNFITVNRIVLPGEVPIEPRQTDGIGRLGTTFLVVRIQNGLIVENNGLETTGEVFEGRQLEAAYDLSDFRVEVRRGE